MSITHTCKNHHRVGAGKSNLCTAMPGTLSDQSSTSTPAFLTAGDTASPSADVKRPVTPRYKRFSSRKTLPGDADFKLRMIAETDSSYYPLKYSDFLTLLSLTSPTLDQSIIINEASQIIRQQSTELDFTQSEDLLYPMLVSTGVRFSMSNIEANGTYMYLVSDFRVSFKKHWPRRERRRKLG